MRSVISALRSVLTAAALAAGLGAGAAGAQDLCEIYTVQQGDTLSDIARTAGVPGGHQTVFNANTDVLRSANIIEIGVRLRIPCADGSLPLATTASAPATVTIAAPVAAPAEVRRPIRFLTAGSYAPFTDESLPETGLFPELIKTAMRNGDPSLDYRIIFVNDWGSHLTDLLPTGAFDMGFPWYLPDCSKVENLEPANAMRCTDYDASDPFFEAVVSFYTLKGSPLETVSRPAQLLGARLCRPDGWFTFDLEADRLVEPMVSMLIAPTQVGCWEALLRGDVDIVTFDALPAEADIQSLGLRDRVVDLPGLSTLATLHVFTPKTNQNGRAYLDVLNAGLEKMRASGEWFEIVARHLSAHNARN